MVENKLEVVKGLGMRGKCDWQGKTGRDSLGTTLGLDLDDGYTNLYMW